MSDQGGGRWAAEDGMAATQLAVLMPAVLLLVMLAVQFALWAHGSHLAAAAADLAAATAALHGSDTGAGEQAAVGLLGQAGNLSDVTVTVATGIDVVDVRVRASAPQLVPGIRFGIDARAQAPREQFTAEGDR